VTFPTFKVEFSPGEAPFDTPVWVEIPITKVASASWSWGRSNELDKFRPGTAEIVLYNDDRLFDPENSAGTYFGLLNPRVPFRITANAGANNLFYGFVEDGWEQIYEPPSNAFCRVRLVDLLSVVEAELLPGSALEVEVLNDTPSAYWRLDEASGTQMLDSSVNGNHGFYDNGLLGQDPIVEGSTKSFEVPHEGDNRGRFSGDTLPKTFPVTLEAWVKFDRDDTARHSIIVVQRDSALGSALWLQVHTAAGGSPNGELVIEFRGLGGFYTARGNTRIDDGQPHHVAMTMSSTAAADIKLYVDGVEQTKTVISGTTGGGWAGHLLWTVGNTVDNGSGDFGLGGLVDEVAIYPSALSAARILAHYNAGATGFAGETTGARIDRVLDIVGVPAGMRDIATGDTFCGPANYASRTAGEYLAKIVESEQGYLYVDHAAGGKIKFRGRYARLTETRSTSSQYTFTDNVTASPAYRYERDSLVIEPNGISSIVNRVDIGWPGGTEVVSDTTSPYGPRGRSIDTEAPSPVAARSAGLWMIARFSDPQVRVRGLGINPGAANVMQTPALDLRVADRVTVVRKPQNTGTTLTNPVIVEGVSHELKGRKWTASYTFSDADELNVWIWGTSTWGETTTWG
jgi:Concanavalin A-like lectin/glucanases superfamily